MSKHIVLLGDSIFDNDPYVPAGETVLDHLQNQFGQWRVTLLAKDGDTTAGIERQMAKMPADASHLALSVGGNDALNSVLLMDTPTETVFQGLGVLTFIRTAFRQNYRKALEAALEPGYPLVVCTIYDAIPGMDDELKTALALFNEVILFEASGRGLPILDLRHLCDSPDDYSDVSPIEPSSLGGAKIAKALSAMILGNSTPRATLHVR